MTCREGAKEAATDSAAGARDQDATEEVRDVGRALLKMAVNSANAMQNIWINGMLRGSVM